MAESPPPPDAFVSSLGEFHLWAWQAHVKRTRDLAATALTTSMTDDDRRELIREIERLRARLGGLVTVLEAGADRD